LTEFGIKVAYTRLGILVAMTFIGLPFVVRTVQPVLEDLETELERLDTLEIIEAELTRERYRELALRTGGRVFIRPRNMRVFP